MPTNRTNLKNYFQKGDKPSALQFAELIDGNLNLEDGGTVAGQTNFTKPITASIISASGTVFASDFQSAGESSQTITFNDNLNVTGSFSMNGPTFDINASSVVTIDGTQITLTTTPTDGVITLHSAHTAGQAILIDANANAGSILDIDAGILDIDVQGVTTINAGDVTITSPQISLQGNVTASGTVTTSGSIVHGNVSASGNIVASGFISASGRLQTLSHITASGNISSSGHISSSGLIVAGGAQVGALVATTLDTGQGANELFDMNQNVTTTSNVFFGFISASGDISGSTIIGENIHSLGHITASGRIQTLSHITASGNISSSGHISSSGLIVAGRAQILGNLVVDNSQTVNVGALTATTINTGQGATEVHLMDQNVRQADAVVFATVDTGQGANELFDMNQNVTTTSDVTFKNLTITGTGSLAVISSSRIDGNGYGNIVISGSLIPGTDDVFDLGSGSKEWSQLVVNTITASGNIKATGTLAAGATTVGALVSTTINTGQGVTEVHLMDQNVREADAVVFATVNTGQGANELYDMDQNVTTTSNVFFGFVSASGDISGSNLDAGGNISAIGHITASGRLQTLSHITASGNISSSGTMIAKAFVETVSTKAAAGGDLAGAAAVDATNVIFATTDDAAKGVRLPALTTLAIGQTITVHNEAASTALRVYPASGDVIGGLAEDGHATVPAKTAIVLTKRDANKFLGYFTTVIA